MKIFGQIRNSGGSLYLISGECQTTDGKECQLQIEKDKIEDYSCSKTRGTVKENKNPCLINEGGLAINNCDSKCQTAHSKCRNEICDGAINRLGMGFRNDLKIASVA